MHNRISKNLLKILSCACLMITVIFFNSQVTFAESDTEEKVMNDYHYIIKEDDTIEIVRYTGSSKNISIPESIENKNVTSIGTAAFSNLSYLETVSMSDAVLIIGNSAFSECYSLKRVSLSSELQTIGDNAFCGCLMLENVTLPEKITKIGNYAFAGCSKIDSIRFSEKLSFIGDYAFLGCTSLKNIQALNKNVSLGSYALEGTSWIKSQNDDWITLTNTILVKYTGNATDVAVPSGILSIASSAFANNENIISISLKNSSVMQIGDRAFKNCTSLTSVVMNSKISSMGIEIFSGCSKISSVTIPNTINKIPEYAFKDCTSLQQIDIPSNIKEISQYAFWGCTSLNKVEIHDGVEIISDFAFGNCTSLGKIEFPQNIKIQSMAFTNCISLTRVHFKGDASPEATSFDGCYNISEVIFETDNVQFDEYTFPSSQLNIYCNTSNASSKPMLYATKKGFETFALNKLPEYKNKGIFSSESKDENNFTSSYTWIAILMILVDVSIVVIFGIYILFFSRKKKRNKVTKM